MLEDSFYKMSDLDLATKRVLIREDLNVPLKDGQITNEERLVRALPTLKAASEAGAKVLVMSHLGRPKEGEFDPQFSLKPIAIRLAELLNQPVKLIQDVFSPIKLEVGEIALLENIRFLKGEGENDDDLSRQLASLCDVFVMDAFATAHRTQASTQGVARFAPMACAGPLLLEELTALSQALDAPAKPLCAIVGGSKVSTKIQLLDALVDKVDLLLVGGGIANTFLKAAGFEVGNSLYEPDWVLKTQQLINKAKASGVEIPLPVDVLVAKELSNSATSDVKSLQQLKKDDCIFDVGPKTTATYSDLLGVANTIVWNGPVGVFEIAAFSSGTQALAKAIAESNAFSIAGGGDTLAAVDQFGIREQISYISTGGGAFLTYLEGGDLPAVQILENRYEQRNTL